MASITPNYEIVSPGAVQQWLRAHSRWNVVDGTLTRQASLKSFTDAVSCVVRVAFEAEALNHHPDIDLRYNVLLFKLSTHDVAQNQGEWSLTQHDLTLASKIEGILTAANDPPKS